MEHKKISPIIRTVHVELEFIGRMNYSLFTKRTIKTQSNLFAVFGNRSPQRMFAVILRCAHDRKQFRAWDPIPLRQHLHLDHFGCSIRDGASFIEDHRLDLKAQTNL